MIIKFNPTGTHTHKGFLKVRVDLYPEPGDKTYAIHHVQVPVIPEEGYPGRMRDVGVPRNWADYNAWIESLPKVWQLNPCLCHFIKVDPDTPLDELMVKQIFDKETASQLDDALSKSETSRVGQIMRAKCGSGKKVAGADINKLNSRLPSLEIKV